MRTQITLQGVTSVFFFFLLHQSNVAILLEAANVLPKTVKRSKGRIGPGLSPLAIDSSNIISLPYHHCSILMRLCCTGWLSLIILLAAGAVLQKANCCCVLNNCHCKQMKAIWVCQCLFNAVYVMAGVDCGWTMGRAGRRVAPIVVGAVVSWHP